MGQDPFKGRCEHCHGELWIVGVAGSPLSGVHEAWGVCPECGKPGRAEGTRLMDLVGQVVEVKKGLKSPSPVKGMTLAKSLLSFRSEIRGA